MTLDEAIARLRDLGFSQSLDDLWWLRERDCAVARPWPIAASNRYRVAIYMPDVIEGDPVLEGADAAP